MTASVPVNYTSRRSHFAHSDGDISNFRTIDANFVIAGTQPQLASTRTIKRFIEYPAGIFTQVTWAGQPTVTISTDNVVSDAINLTIPKGAEFWERTVNVGGVVSTFPCQQTPASSQVIGIPDGNSASDLGNSGTISATSAVTTFGATAMIGDIASANARSWVIVGDSIAFGEGDITGVGAKRASGWIARALDVYGYPYVKITKPGQQATEFATALSLVTPFVALLSFTDVISEHGINDLRLARTQAQVLADHQTIYDIFPGKTIAQTTLTPRAASTDGYATTANQSGRTDGTMAALVALNTSIRAKPAKVSKVIDAADVAMSARDSLIWPAPPVPTADGTHPNSYMANVMAAALAAQLVA
jgi:lysophospholipase L1-like esterase